MRTSVVEEVNETIKAPSVVLHHVLPSDDSAPQRLVGHEPYNETETERERDCMIRVR
jgi:hypothetical protein